MTWERRQKQLFTDVLLNGSEKFRTNDRKTPVLESPFNKVTGLFYTPWKHHKTSGLKMFFEGTEQACNVFKKRLTPTLVFFCEYCEIFKNSFFIEHLWWLLPERRVCYSTSLIKLLRLKWEILPKLGFNISKLIKIFRNIWKFFFILQNLGMLLVSVFAALIVLLNLHRFELGPFDNKVKQLKGNRHDDPY